MLAIAAAGPVLIDSHPALAGPTTAAAGQRDFETILDEYQQLNAKVIALVGSPDDLLDPAKREAIAKDAIPLLQKLNGLADEMSSIAGPAAQFGPQLKSNVDPVLAMFGDKAAIARLEALAGDDAKPDALRARAALLSAEWIRSNRDPAVQAELLDRAETIARDNPTNDNLAELLWRFADSAATPELSQRAKSIATTVLKGELATEIKAQLEADARLAALIGKPLTIAGTRHEGTPFTSDDWKGKVVVVDIFVAGWPPSQRGTLQIAQLYEKLHASGLEVVGLCCDDDPAELARFLKENPQVKWPILYDAQKPGIHPIAQALGVSDPHSVVVIDKTGTVRSTDARQTLETLVTQLLSE